MRAGITRWPTESWGRAAGAATLFSLGYQESIGLGLLVRSRCCLAGSRCFVGIIGVLVSFHLDFSKYLRHPQYLRVLKTIDRTQKDETPYEERAPGIKPNETKRNETRKKRNESGACETSKRRNETKRNMKRNETGLEGHIPGGGPLRGVQLPQGRRRGRAEEQLQAPAGHAEAPDAHRGRAGGGALAAAS